MHDALGPDTVLGYCTNVHAGATYEQTLANLERYALAVKQRVSPDQPMGVGLWLSAQAARPLVERDAAAELRQWLNAHGLTVFTLNGFPYGNFHEPVVKHRVYRPDWRDPARTAYTRDLIAVLAELLPEGGEGSISTLPIGWGDALSGDGRAGEAAAAQLLEIAGELARVEDQTGKLMHLNLEPEPGCVFDTSQGAIDFFERHLLRPCRERQVRRHLRLCHDVCHAAVMFEDQGQALNRYHKWGLRVGKVQVSSAVCVPFEAMDPPRQRQAAEQLAAFAEDRYLHQTVVRDPDGSTTFYEDLPDALAQAPRAGEWRIHFHVPIYLERFGLLQTSREQIAPCLAVAAEMGVRHYEVETYAWGVLPEALQQAELAAGIAQEMQWLIQDATVQP